MCGIFLLASGVLLSAAGPAWLSQGPKVGEGPQSFEIPLEVEGQKLYVEVEIGGRTRRFVVDTGSPSMVDESIARELNLKVVGKSQGRDAHGVKIETSIVQSDLSVGGVSFEKVPLFCADFLGTVPVRCIVGDGILGSELLALGAWQIDLKERVLRFSTQAETLPYVEKATEGSLHDFGFPHAPIVDVVFAKEARSKALFDTGAPVYFWISPDDYAGAQRAGGTGGTLEGFGSPGGSLGGQAPAVPREMVELTSFSVGPVQIGVVEALVRELSPSLLGVRFLDHFIVTLDQPNGAVFFYEYAKGPYIEDSFGLTLAFDGEVAVGTVWEGSPAWRAGLRAGDPLDSINGMTLDFSCEKIRQAIAAFQEPTIRIDWEGGSVELTKETREF